MTTQISNPLSMETFVAPLASCIKDNSKPLPIFTSSETDSHSHSEGGLNSPQRTTHSDFSSNQVTSVKGQCMEQYSLQPFPSSLAFPPTMNLFGQSPKVPGFPPISTWSPPQMFVPPGMIPFNGSYTLMLPMMMSPPMDKLPSLTSQSISDSKLLPTLNSSLSPLSQGAILRPTLTPASPLLPQTPTCTESFTPFEPRTSVTCSLESHSIHTITEESSQADIAEILDSMKSQADGKASNQLPQLKTDTLLPPTRGTDVQIPAIGVSFSSFQLPSLNPNFVPLGSGNMAPIQLPFNVNPTTGTELPKLTRVQSLDSSVSHSGRSIKVESATSHDRRGSGSDYSDDGFELETKPTRPYRRRHTLKFDSILPQTPHDKEIMEKYSFKNLYLTHAVENGTLFKCHICDYSSIQVGNLQQHLYSHEGVKPFQCDECDYASSFQSALIRHMKTHTSERKFKCPECDYSVHQSYNLRRHLIKKHNKSMDEASEVIKTERLAAKHER